MNEVKLINGSWVQTMSTILNEINIKLDDTEIADIIKRIDDRISDEEMLEILGDILLKLSSLESDNIEIKNNILDILKLVSNIISNTSNLKSDIDVIRVDNNFIKSNINDILKRLNGISIVRQMTIKEYQPKAYIKMRKVYVPPKKREVIVDETFMIDQSLEKGYVEGYKIQKYEGIYSFHPQLYWLINGNRRRLIYKGKEPITDDIKKIFESYGIK